MYNNKKVGKGGTYVSNGLLTATYSESPTGKRHHYHDGHQLLFIAKGEVNLSVGNTQQTVSEGALLLFSRFEEHSIAVAGDVYHRYSLRIPHDFSDAKIRELLLSVLVNRAIGIGNVLYPRESAEKIEHLFCRMCEECTAQGDMHEEMMAALLCQLLIEIKRLLPQESLTNKEESTALVLRVQGFLENAYAERVTLSRLAELYHVSVSYLSHSFKAVTGCSVMEYLFACRLLAAKRLLANTEISVGEIVEACGFCDDSNFSRSFRQKVGVTPSEFRRRYQKDVAH